MLVLSRKKYQQIQIGPITVTVVGIERGKVRIGIDAPDDYGISRPDAVHREPKDRPMESRLEPAGTNGVGS